jgi:hypothetical protein
LITLTVVVFCTFVYHGILYLNRQIGSDGGFKGYFRRLWRELVEGEQGAIARAKKLEGEENMIPLEAKAKEIPDLPEPSSPSHSGTSAAAPVVAVSRGSLSDSGSDATATGGGTKRKKSSAISIGDDSANDNHPPPPPPPEMELMPLPPPPPAEQDDAIPPPPSAVPSSSSSSTPPVDVPTAEIELPPPPPSHDIDDSKAADIKTNDVVVPSDAPVVVVPSTQQDGDVSSIITADALLQSSLSSPLLSIDNNTIVSGSDASSSPSDLVQPLPVADVSLSSNDLL